MMLMSRVLGLLVVSLMTALLAAYTFTQVSVRCGEMGAGGGAAFMAALVGLTIAMAAFAVN